MPRQSGNRSTASSSNGAASAPVTLPALKNRLLGAHLLTAPDTKVAVTTGEREWHVGPIGGQAAAPFVVVALSVEGMPEAGK